MPIPKKTVAIMNGYFEEMIGGTEYQTYLLAKAAKERGHEVHHLFLSSKREYINPIGIYLHPIKRIEIRRTFGAAQFLYRKQLLATLEMIKPDVVYCRNTTSWVGISAYYATKHINCKSILHIPHIKLVIPRPYYQYWKKPFEFIEEYWRRYGIKHHTSIIAHAQYQARLLEKNYGRTAHTILKMQPEPTEYIDKSGPKTVIWVGNFKPEKRPDIFVRLVRKLREEGSEVRFIMIGKVDPGTRYVKQVRDEIINFTDIELLGEQPIEEVNRQLANAHIFVSTYVPEGFSNTYVQAWMREVPIVTYSWDPDDIIKNERLGIVSGSFENLVRDVLLLLKDDKQRDQMGKRARKYAMEHHSLSKNMKELMQLIEE